MGNCQIYLCAFNHVTICFGDYYVKMEVADFRQLSSLIDSVLLEIDLRGM